MFSLKSGGTMPIRNTLLTALVICFTSPAFGKQIRSHVGQAQVSTSLIAAAPFNHNFSNKRAQTYINGLYIKLQNNLLFSGLVSVLSQQAFQENTLAKSIYPKSKDPVSGFSFESWSNLNADFLVRSQIVQKKGFKGDLQIVVYNVKSRQEWLNYKAEINITKAHWAINRFSNHFYKRLSGKKGFYETKVTAVLGSPRRKGQTQRKNVYIMNWDGSEKQAITKGAYPHFSPTWSYDKRYVAYSGYYYHKKNKQLNIDIFIYDTKKRKTQLFSYRKGINSSPAFFPDGKNMLASLETWGRRQIFKLPIGSSNSRKIYRIDGIIPPAIEPDISPNGTQMVYSGSNPPRVYILNLATGKHKRLTHAGRYNSSPKWSPTGNLIAFSGYPDNSDHFEIYTITPNGKNLKKITNLRKASGRAAQSEHPSFSPDGQLILFTSNAAGKNQLHISNLRGNIIRRLTFDNYEYFMPEWSP